MEPCFSSYWNRFNQNLMKRANWVIYIWLWSYFRIWWDRPVGSINGSSEVSAINTAAWIFVALPSRRPQSFTKGSTTVKLDDSSVAEDVLPPIKFTVRRGDQAETRDYGHNNCHRIRSNHIFNCIQCIYIDRASIFWWVFSPNHKNEISIYYWFKLPINFW